MKTSPNPEGDRLDGRLDKALTDLPELEAPASLLPQVMARIAREEKKERLSRFATMRWVIVFVSAGCALGATYFSPELMAHLSRYLTVHPLADGMELVHVCLQLFATVFNAVGKVFGLISLTALLPIVTVIIVFSASSLAGIATLVFQLTFSAAGRPTGNLVYHE
ncbi:MAG: hypothetical protein F7B06_00550 [Opitutae bacterium]|nr:hypothetical protein [Opitutae bacterium]